MRKGILLFSFSQQIHPQVQHISPWFPWPRHMLSYCCYPFPGQDGPSLLALRAWSTAEEIHPKIPTGSCCRTAHHGPHGAGRPPAFAMSMHSSVQAEPLVYALPQQRSQEQNPLKSPSGAKPASSHAGLSLLAAQFVSELRGIAGVKWQWQCNLMLLETKFFQWCLSEEKGLVSARCLVISVQPAQLKARTD